MQTVAVFGGGIAGLTVAHEFVRRGYAVSVYEANENAGGFFRSARLAKDDGMPSEYSWHGMGPLYHNVFDIMKQIPFDETGSVYEKGLSRPIAFGVAPDVGIVQFDDSPIILRTTKKMFRMSWLETCRWAWLMGKTWSANRRSFENYARLNAAEQWGRVLSEKAGKTWRASFGPWIGSDWTNVSLHTVGRFFLRLLLTKPAHMHPADAKGPSWRHGSRDGWLLLRGPSNEYWIDRWVTYLMKNNVTFHWKSSVQKFDYDGHTITGASLDTGERIEANIYVMATNPFAAAQIFDRTPAIAELEQLHLFHPLVQDGPHTQVSFRIAFSEKIFWPRKRAAVILADSAFNLTLFAEEQAWGDAAELGKGIVSLWTVTACVATVPGTLYGKPIVTCTKEQFLEEALEQLYRCKSLDRLIRDANGDRSLKTFTMQKITVWHEWIFSPDGIKPHQPKWVDTTNTQPYRPTQKTPIPNLLLAGAHTKTAMDIWSIEGAVESGRRAVQIVEPDVVVLPQYEPWLLRFVRMIDDYCYGAGLPHVFDILLVVVPLLIIGVIVRYMYF